VKLGRLSGAKSHSTNGHLSFGNPIAATDYSNPALGVEEQFNRQRLDLA
jgi:hypothetical protein